MYLLRLLGPPTLLYRDGRRARRNPLSVELIPGRLVRLGDTYKKGNLCQNTLLIYQLIQGVFTYDVYHGLHSNLNLSTAKQ